MGTKYEYCCPSCGYKDMVAGGEDSGFNFSTVTISCQQCRRLHEAVTARRPSGRTFKVRCPKGADHVWELWTFPGPCPRCGVTMVEGELMMDWD